MPPTPFHPTHTTPFKSSISSSQQARKPLRNGASSTSATTDKGMPWPSTLSAYQLDARDWTYLAEGGKNMLLRYQGANKWPFVTRDGRSVALRLTKAARSATQQHVGDRSDEIEQVEWQQAIIARCLCLATRASHSGREQAEEDPTRWLLPLMRVQAPDPEQLRHLQTFVTAMADKIEAMRPMERRKAGGIGATLPSEVFVTEDLGAFSSDLASIVFEIKPKCGFLPNAEFLSPATAPIKTRFSRYRMHRIHKDKSQAITSHDLESMYDPLDLYCGNRAGTEKACAALLEGWTKSPASQNNLRVFVGQKRLDGSTGRQEAEAAAVRCNAPANGDLHGLLVAALTSEEVQEVLARLVAAQRLLDPIDVEGVDQLYRASRGKSLADASDEPPITLDEYRLAVECAEQQASHGAVPPSNVRIAMAQLLLSTALKDCSLFIKCTAPAAAETEKGPHMTVHLVDLDPKPVSKLPYLYQVDASVVASFTEWATKAGIEA